MSILEGVVLIGSCVLFLVISAVLMYQDSHISKYEKISRRAKWIAERNKWQK